MTSVSPPTLRDLRSAAEALRARGEPFACLVSALGHPELGRRSLLADGLALEWSLMGTGIEERAMNKR